MLWILQLKPKREACREIWLFNTFDGSHPRIQVYIFTCHIKPNNICLFIVFGDILKLIAVSSKQICFILRGYFIILVCFVFRSGWRREWENTTLSDKHGVSPKLTKEEAWSLAGAAESSCWQQGRREVESVSELAGWHSYHGTNSLDTEKTAAKQETGRDSSRVGPAVRVPVPVPISDPDPDSQSTSMPSGTHRWFAPRWMWV